jgi:hypothetical protein
MEKVATGGHGSGADVPVGNDCAMTNEGMAAHATANVNKARRETGMGIMERSGLT